MLPTIWSLLLGFALGSLIAGLILFLGQRAGERRLIQSYEQRLRQMEDRYRKEIEKARHESVEQSRRTLKGQLAEGTVK